MAGRATVTPKKSWLSRNSGIVMAATEPDAPPHRRYSQILVPTDTPGLELVRPISVMGHRSGPGHWEVRFKDVRVPLENVLGELRQSLREASYAPLPVRERTIPNLNRK